MRRPPPTPTGQRSGRTRVSELVYPVDDVLWPSIGGDVLDWMQAFACHGPGDVVGQPLKLSQEQEREVYRLYEVYPHGHERAGVDASTRRLMKCKSWSKTELMALIAFAELLGRFGVTDSTAGATRSVGRWSIRWRSCSRGRVAVGGTGLPHAEGHRGRKRAGRPPERHGAVRGEERRPRHREVDDALTQPATAAAPRARVG